MPPPVLFIDVDDTLIRSFGSKRLPISGMAELVRGLHRAGATLYLWSTGGADYARAAAEEMGITDCFVAFLPKPQALIDDVPIARWPLRELHPNECLGRDVAEILATLC